MPETATIGEQVREFIALQDEMIKQHCRKPDVPYQSTFDFLIQHGRLWEPAPLPGDVPLGEPKRCFENVAMFVVERDDLTYVEGYALPQDCPIPIPHAWLVDRDGGVVERTLRSPGTVYFGVAFRTSVVIGRMLKTGYATSMLDDWRHDWPLLHGELSTEDALEGYFHGEEVKPAGIPGR